jgi:predicted component of type VI protein secretion system
MGLLNQFREKKLNRKDEVIEHLVDFLNTKKFSGSFPLDYGIESYVYLGSSNRALMQFMSDLKADLEKFEKRLKDIEITNIPSESSFLLCFSIKCHIEETPFSFQISFSHQKNSFQLESR